MFRTQWASASCVVPNRRSSKKSWFSNRYVPRIMFDSVPPSHKLSLLRNWFKRAFDLLKRKVSSHFPSVSPSNLNPGNSRLSELPKESSLVLQDAPSHFPIYSLDMLWPINGSRRHNVLLIVKAKLGNRQDNRIDHAMPLDWALETPNTFKPQVSPAIYHALFLSMYLPHVGRRRIYITWHQQKFLWNVDSTRKDKHFVSLERVSIFTPKNFMTVFLKKWCAHFKKS